MEMVMLFLQLFFCALRYRKRNVMLSSFILLTLMLLPTTVMADRSAIVELEVLDHGTQKPLDPSRMATGHLMKGTFSKTGSIKPVQGQLLSLSDSDECGSNDEADLAERPKKDWVAVLHYPKHTNRFETNDSDCNSVMDRVKNAMLFGASAILILALNPKVLKELEMSPLLSGPIVLIQDIENITAILRAIASQIKLTVKITYNTSFYDLQKVSTLTLWSTCGRSSGVSAYNEWEGVVCLGNSETKGKEHSTWHYLVSGVFLLLLLMIMKNNRDDPEEHDNSAECKLRHLACQVMGQMRCYRYCIDVQLDNSDSCAVCLDNYHYSQLIRELPCGHIFHAKCVDAWLIAQRTCPLCKRNILDLSFSK